MLFLQAWLKEHILINDIGLTLSFALMPGVVR